MDKIRTAYKLAITLINLIGSIGQSRGTKKLTLFKSDNPSDNITITNDNGFFKVVHSFAGQTITYDNIAKIITTVGLNFIEFHLSFGTSNEHISIQIQYRVYDLIHEDYITSSGYWYPSEQYEIPYWDISDTMMNFAYCGYCGEPYEINGGDTDLCPDCVYRMEHPEEEY